jgi:hypothetical protein
MKLIKVTYRNVFTQPIGVLNPMNLKLPGEFPVEVFEVGSKWKIREIASPNRRVYEKLGEHVNARIAMERVEECFVSFRDVASKSWQVWATVPDDASPTLQTMRIVLPGEIAIVNKDGRERTYFREAEDYTHIIHAPTLDTKQRVPSAACGASVKADAFINNRANVEPTCTGCAVVWKEHYQKIA